MLDHTEDIFIPDLFIISMVTSAARDSCFTIFAQ